MALEGLIGEVEHKHWRGGSLPDLYRVRVHHPKSGITVTDDFTMDEIMGPLVELNHHDLAEGTLSDNAGTEGLSSDPDKKRRRLDRTLRRNPHGEDCSYWGKDNP